MFPFLLSPEEYLALEIDREYPCLEDSINTAGYRPINSDPRERRSQLQFYHVSKTYTVTRPSQSPCVTPFSHRLHPLVIAELQAYPILTESPSSHFVIHPPTANHRSYTFHSLLSLSLSLRLHPSPPSDAILHILPLCDPPFDGESPLVHLSLTAQPQL
jgi:hypothetical protein